MNLRKISVYLILLCSLAFFAEGFTLRASATTRKSVRLSAQTREPRNFDALNYTIRTKFDRPNRTIIGDTTIRLKPLADGFKIFSLDANDFTVESVTLEPAGTSVEFQTSPTNIKITLDKDYSAGEMLEVRVKYRVQGNGIPKPNDSGGVFFIPESKEKNGHSAQIWTQGEPEDNRDWFPAYDLPDDKVTSEQFITVEKGETAIANGDLLETLENEDGTQTFHFKLDIPHSSYLISFIVGKYARVEDKHNNVKLGYYIYPGTEGIVSNTFAKTPKMMAVYEKLTGIPFPYSKYDQTVVRNFTFGGMENITATTHNDEEIYAAKSPLFVSSAEDLISHELAHSWFGDLVTCKNWTNLWLNEGFATFMEAVYRESQYGKENYVQTMTTNASLYFADNDNDHPLFNLAAKPNPQLFDTITYKKGGFVLNMLRQEVGDEVFWKAVNLYLSRHKFQNVETTDLQKAFEEVSGKDLNWFFEQWVYKSGYPQMSAKPRYNAKTKTYTLTVTQKQTPNEQTQTPNEQTPEIFRFNTEIELFVAKKKQIEKIEMTKRAQTFTFKVAAKPKRVVFDPNEKVLDKTDLE